MASYGTGADRLSDTRGQTGSIKQEHQTPTRGGGDTGADPLLGEPNPLSRKTKFCFALGALPNALSVTTTGFFLNPFLLEVAGVSAGLVSAMMLAGRAWDAITTAIAGGLISRSQGLRKWLGIGIMPTCAAYFFLWMVFDGLTDGGKAAFAFSMYLAYQLFSSCYQVPYTAMTVRLHQSPEERDKATAWRMLAEILSVLIGAGGQSVILAAYDANNDCTSCELDDGGSSSAKQAYLVSAILMTAIFGLGGVLCFIFVRERIVPGSDDSTEEGSEPKQRSPTGMESVKAAFTSRAFLTLTFAYFFIWLTAQAVQGNILLYCKYAVPAYKDKFQYLLIVLVLTSTFGMPVWYKIMKKIGKRYAYIIGGACWVPLLHILFYIPMLDNPSVWYGVVTCFLSGFFLAAVYLLPWAMLPNVVDAVEYETGQRHEAVFYAFFVFFMKMGAGLALAGSALILNVVGWKDDPCCPAADGYDVCDCSNEDSCNCDVQPDSVGDALKYIVGVGGPVLVLIGVFLAYLYPITPEKEKEIALGLEARRDGRAVSGNAEMRASLRHSVASFNNTAHSRRATLPDDLFGGKMDTPESVRGRSTTLSLPSPGLDQALEVKTG
eukprot:Hpha_TRINITY_DN14430_c0_g2::TRINITY_DN14430_c0_g2_i1::g.157492::m.157492